GAAGRIGNGGICGVGGAGAAGGAGGAGGWLVGNGGAGGDSSALIGYAQGLAPIDISGPATPFGWGGAGVRGEIAAF
ncbi:hypothetical protein K4G80_20580, partial [Mycobacterium tuberculosis]|nr:hypothetical protein [Mycobacterium tuberculosis]